MSRRLLDRVASGLLLGLRLGLVALLACGVASEPMTSPSPPSAARPIEREADSLLGQSARAFEVDHWIEDARLSAGPASIEALRGSVVFVRFWTDTCPYCRATAPALVELDREFRDRGLVVLGLHHPKPRPAADAPFDRLRESSRIADIAVDMGFRFAIGLDWHWRTLGAWWLSDRERPATSAAFLVDRAGVIRWVHPGPEFHPDGPADHDQCRADYAALRRMIEALLAA